MNETPFVLEAKQLTVGYDGVPLIRDITFALERGEILTLIGPNGAGKTTILRNLIRQLRPIAGTVVLSGEDLQAVCADGANHPGTDDL